MNLALDIEDEEEDRGGRPVWLTTLADLGLLLVGFFVFLQASQALDRGLLVNGFRAGFDAAEPAPMPVALATLEGFAQGSAALPLAPHVVAWAREAARDPRTRITVTGEHGPADVDLATGSGAILAADRARAAAAMLVESGAVPAGRIDIATAEGRARVVLTLGFGGAPE